jgi:hypothetical protein
MAMNWVSGNWGGMLTSLLQGVSMPNDDNTQKVDPYTTAATTNPITKDLVVSREESKHVIQSLKDGANDCVKLNNIERRTWSHTQRKVDLGVDRNVSSSHVKHTQGVSD